jgi:predicted nucleic acid-binding protein
VTRYVVDASVAVKWFVPEVHSLEAAALLEPAHTLYAPDLLFAEVGNVVWKKTRRHELRPAEARVVLRGLAAVPFEVTPTRDLLTGALDLALHVGCTAYDAMYLALAIHHECRLVTADRRLRELVGRRSLARHVSVLPYTE